MTKKEKTRTKVIFLFEEDEPNKEEMGQFTTEFNAFITVDSQLKNEKSSNRKRYLKRAITALFKNGGRREARTPDIFLVREALYQLSYAPENLFNCRASKGSFFITRLRLWATEQVL